MAAIGHGYESRPISPTRIRGRLPPFGGPASQAHASNLRDRAEGFGTMPQTCSASVRAPL